MRTRPRSCGARFRPLERAGDDVDVVPSVRFGRRSSSLDVASPVVVVVVVRRHDDDVSPSRRRRRANARVIDVVDRVHDDDDDDDVVIIIIDRHRANERDGVEWAKSPSSSYGECDVTRGTTTSRTRRRNGEITTHSR